MNTDRIVDGKLDALGMMQQLGAIPRWAGRQARGCLCSPFTRARVSEAAGVKGWRRPGATGVSILKCYLLR